MISRTKFSVNSNLISRALEECKFDNFKTSLNKPTGSFFYDPWVLSEEFKGTVWEEILATLNVSSIGEARIIKLDIERCYTMHSDIDDRWHLALSEGMNFLVDLENQKFHSTNPGFWYIMDAGRLHSAVNFGDWPRYQLVIRKLLIPAVIENSVSVNIKVQGEHSRYKFDSTVSPWLNRANKSNQLNSFEVKDNVVKFNTSIENINNLKKIIPEEFDTSYA